LLASEDLWTQTPAGKPFRIDVHHHYSPPVWVRESKAGLQKQQRQPLSDIYDNWSPARSLEAMDRAGFASAAISITNPGVYFGDRAAAVRLARECNEFGARMAADHPGRYGLLGILPLPDLDASLREIEYILDKLKAVGLGLMTNYWDTWLSDEAFWPVLEELNRRRAVVYTHPTTAQCCDELVPKIDRTTIEFGTDTTRLIVSLLNNGAAKRFPQIRWVFSHGGGTMPFLIGRIIGTRAQNLDAPAEPDSELSHLRRFYYDTAAVSNSASLGALKKVVGASQIMYGTDNRGQGDGMQRIVDSVQASGVFSAGELQKIERENALQLFPAFRT
jgi:predicted TIM-barrel fold metal-dependent hydrolase